MTKSFEERARDVVNEIERDYGEKGIILIITEALKQVADEAKQSIEWPDEDEMAEEGSRIYYKALEKFSDMNVPTAFCLGFGQAFKWLKERVKPVARKRVSDEDMLSIFRQISLNTKALKWEIFKLGFHAAEKHYGVE